MVSTSLKGQIFIFEYPPRLIPSQITMRNFIVAWTSKRFDQYFLNSVLVTICTTLFVVFLSSMMAYAIARLRFKLRKVFYNSIRVFMMMPTMAIIIPQFILASKLNLLNSLLGLIFVYVAQNLSLSTFILTGFFEQIPIELEDAAKIDGASSWKIYQKIILPLSKPALATVAIFSSLGAWDEYVWALTVLNDPNKRTLPVGIAAFQGQFYSDWGVVFAASVLAVTPIIILFILMQKYFIKGVFSGSIKG
jgi:multiple sugar transport system permease protein